MKAFGRAGAGFFLAPTAMEKEICAQYKVVAVGEVPSIVEEIYVITAERKLNDPAILAISQTAKRDIFN
jgi:LysR family transcriptional activator of nhaA